MAAIRILHLRSDLTWIAKMHKKYKPDRQLYYFSSKRISNNLHHHVDPCCSFRCSYCCSSSLQDSWKTPSHVFTGRYVRKEGKSERKRVILRIMVVLIVLFGLLLINQPTFSRFKQTGKSRRRSLRPSTGRCKFRKYSQDDG